MVSNIKYLLVDCKMDLDADRLSIQSGHLPRDYLEKQTSGSWRDLDYCCGLQAEKLAGVDGGKSLKTEIRCNSSNYRGAPCLCTGADYRAKAKETHFRSFTGLLAFANSRRPFRLAE